MVLLKTFLIRFSKKHDVTCANRSFQIQVWWNFQRNEIIWWNTTRSPKVNKRIEGTRHMSDVTSKELKRVSKRKIGLCRYHNSDIRSIRAWKIGFRGANPFFHTTRFIEPTQGKPLFYMTRKFWLHSKNKNLFIIFVIFYHFYICFYYHFMFTFFVKFFVVVYTT